MMGYAETQIFTSAEVALLREATRLVDLIPSDHGRIRCHELARAIGRALGLDVQDGQYGYVEHSWLWTRPREHDVDSGRLLPNVLDVYVPGGLPQVQLVHLSAALQSVYRWGRSRDDIRQDDVDWCSRWMVYERKGQLFP